MTQAEYGALDASEMQIVDLVNGGIAALKGLNLDGKSANYRAIVTFSANNPKMNGIIIAIPEIPLPTERGGSCNVCGISSAYNCINKVKKWMNDNHTDSVDLHIERGSDGCAKVSW